jgi:hypothetical protein
VDKSADVAGDAIPVLVDVQPQVDGGGLEEVPSKSSLLGNRRGQG